MLSVTTFLIHPSVCPQVELRMKTYGWTNKKAQMCPCVLLPLCYRFTNISGARCQLTVFSSVLHPPTSRSKDLRIWSTGERVLKQTCLRNMLSKQQLPAFEIRRHIGPDFRELHHKVMWLFWSESQAELRSLLAARPKSVCVKVEYVCVDVFLLIYEIELWEQIFTRGLE